MPLFPMFLLLSLLLHFAAGFFLLGRDMAPVAAVQSMRTAHHPAVVQIRLEPATVQQAMPAKPHAPVAQSQSKPQPVLPPRPAKQPAETARTRLKPAAVAAASTAKTEEKTAAQPASVSPHLPVAAATREVTTPAPPAEVFSRHPAFRLPPQQPRYPAQARRRNQEGVVLLEVRLDERGAQRAIKLLRSSGFPSLDKAALEAVAGWRFHPETVNGKGVPSRVQIPIEFALLASR